MKFFFAFSIVFFAQVNHIVLAQKMHVEVYKDGKISSGSAKDSARRAQSIAELKYDIHQTGRQIDSIGKRLSGLYSDTAALHKSSGSDAFNTLINQLQNQLDALVQQMSADKDKLQDLHDNAQANGDSGQVNLGKYHIVIWNSDTTKAGNASLPPIPDMGPCPHHPDYVFPSAGFKWGGIGLGFNGLLDQDKHTSNGALALNNAKSIEANINVFRQYFNLVGHHLYFTYGMDLTYNNYRLNNKVNVLPNQSVFTTTTADLAYNKDKLLVNWVQLPVALRYESNKYHFKHSVHIEAGVYGGYRYNTHSKVVQADGSIVKHWDSFNLNDFDYGTRVLVGYGPVSLYATYALSSFFKDNQGIPNVTYYPFSMGIVLKHI